MSLRIAMLSFWHVHAKDYARHAATHPDVDIAAVWDEDPSRGRKWAIELGVEFHDDLADVLQRPDIDAVVVDTPTVGHRDVIVAAAEAGKHIFTEKVLAPTVTDCADILAAVGKAGVTLVVSLPRLYDASTLAIQKVIDEGLLGQVTLVRVRLAHGGAVGEQWLPEHFYDPAQTVGGALIDLGCHPMYLARLFLGGLPATVSADFGTVSGRAVEDNAVVVLRYPDGALGVVEAGFVTTHSPFSVEVHGTEGSLLFGTPEPRLLVRSDRAGTWTQMPLPDRLPTAFEQFVQHVRDGTSATANIDMSVDLTRLMQAAYQSARTGRPVSIDEGSS